MRNDQAPGNKPPGPCGESWWLLHIGLCLSRKSRIWNFRRPVLSGVRLFLRADFWAGMVYIHILHLNNVYPCHSCPEKWPLHDVEKGGRILRGRLHNVACAAVAGIPTLPSPQ